MKEMKRQHHALWLAAAGLLPIASLIVMYWWLGIYPFGGKTLLAVDLNNQYISFFSYLREVLHGSRSPFYSFSKTLGGDMMGLTAYYLMSPLNLLFLLFPVRDLPQAVLLITLLKTGLSGVSFFLLSGDFYTVDHRNTTEASLKRLLISCAYALMAYSIVYQQNIMWMDGIVLLPLVILGLRRLCRGKAPFLYIAALFLAIMTNYYIGYMICLYSVLYFAYTWIFCFEGRAGRLRVLLRYSAASLLGGGLSMMLLLPTLRSLQGGKSSFDLSVLQLKQNFALPMFLSKLYAGSFSFEELMYGLPNVFCGSIALLCIVLFFLNKNIRLRGKCGAALLILASYLSLNIYALFMIWHGMNVTTWFPYRFSFIFSFTILVLAAESLCKMEDLRMAMRTAGCLVFLAGYAGIAYVLSHWEIEYMTRLNYLVSVGAAALAVLTILIVGRRRKALTAGILLCLTLGELTYSGAVSLKSVNYKDLETYQAFVDEIQPAVEAIKAKDTGWYRIEKTVKRNNNDPMLFSYDGLSHYSSTEKTRTKDFMGYAGFRNAGTWTYYNRGSSYAMDSLLGVKYIMSREPLPEPYQAAEQVGDITIYENTYALPMAFAANQAVLQTDYSDPDKCRMQNRIWSSLSDYFMQSLFRSETIEDVKLKNLAEDEEQIGLYHKIDKQKKAYIEYRFTAASDDPVFAYFDTDTLLPVKMKVNGTSLGNYFDTYQYDVVRLGTFKQGESVKVRMVLSKDDVKVTGSQIFYEDSALYENYSKQMQAQGMEVTSHSDTKITGTITTDRDDQCLMTTIPNDPGWHVVVDGEEQDIETALGIFAAVKLNAGTHDVCMYFEPIGIREGVILSGISLVVVGVWVLLFKKRF